MSKWKYLEGEKADYQKRTADEAFCKICILSFLKS